MTFIVLMKMEHYCFLKFLIKIVSFDKKIKRLFFSFNSIKSFGKFEENRFSFRKRFN